MHNDRSWHDEDVTINLVEEHRFYAVSWEYIVCVNILFFGDRKLQSH